MATVCVEEDLAVQAARILLTLKSKRLLRPLELIQKEPAPAVAELRWPLEGGRRKRNGGRRRGNWRAATTLRQLGRFASSASAGSVPCSSGQERERSPAPPRCKDRPVAGHVRDEATAALRQDSAPSGSGPSTSANSVARPREKAPMARAVAEPPKQPMKAPSPETPLDFGASAAGSGASWSGDDAARPPSKRRAPGAFASGGGAFSGDEGCSSPDKRARVAEDGDGGRAISEPTKQETAPGDRRKFAFDLNLLPDDDEDSQGFC